jgi:retinoid hydroxylase
MTDSPQQTLRDRLKPASLMPSSSQVSQIVGLFAKPELFFFEQYQKHGEIFKVSPPFFGSNIACLVGPEANRFLLKDGADRLSSRLGNAGLEPIVSTDLVLLKDGEEHRASRKMILPVFHHQAIAAYFDTMQAVVSETVVDWGTKDTFDLNTEIRKLTLSVVVRTFLGSEQAEDIDRVCEWFNTLLESLGSLIKWDVSFTKHGKGQAARREIVEYSRQLIRSRIKRGNLDESTDFLGLLMNILDEDGQPFFTETQIINQIIGFLFAGHETTASLMNWILFELGNRPEWRQKLRDELQQVTGNQPLSIKHLRQLPQMSNVLKEGERLYPPAAGLARVATADIEYAGYNIPAGWYVMIFPQLTHRMPEIYREPDLFDPDRFAAPREEDKQHSYSLIGFGGGVHSCLGVEFANMEMKIILTTLLQKYNWTVMPTTAEISPVRNPVAMQKKLKAKFVPI